MPKSCDTTKLLFVGDCHLRTGGQSLRPHILEKINQSSAFVFNCETVISNFQESVEKRTALRVRPEDVYFFDGIETETVAVLSNNHSADYKEVGFADTVMFLTSRHVSVSGFNNECLIKRIGNLTVGFLSYSQYGNKDIINIANPNTLRKIQVVKPNVDYLVITIHWGYEYVLYPHRQDMEFARAVIDAGADLVIGHHPHVIQGYEVYRSGYIFYSLGNFQFGVPNEQQLNSNIGLMVEIDLEKNGVTMTPIYIDNFLMPNVLKEKQQERVMEQFTALSNALKKNKLLYTIHWYVVASKMFLKSNFASWFIRIRRYGLRHFVLMVRTAISRPYIKMYLGFLLGGFLHRQKDLLQD